MVGVPVAHPVPLGPTPRRHDVILAEDVAGATVALVR